MNFESISPFIIVQLVWHYPIPKLAWGAQFTSLAAFVLRIIFSYKVWQLQQIKTKNHSFHY
jgi:hypothetical protein